MQKCKDMSESNSANAGCPEMLAADNREGVGTCDWTEQVWETPGLAISLIL